LHVLIKKKHNAKGWNAKKLLNLKRVTLKKIQASPNQTIKLAVQMMKL